MTHLLFMLMTNTALCNCHSPTPPQLKLVKRLVTEMKYEEEKLESPDDAILTIQEKLLRYFQ
jgi:hypothetical protein